MTQRTTTLRIHRGSPNQNSVFDDFEFPYYEGMSILDALIWIRSNLDETLAIRYSCTNANTCKECMVKVGKKIVYACTERLHASKIIVEPLPNKRLIRDLVTDIVPPKENLSNLLRHADTEC